MKIVISHPTGNQNVRAAVAGFVDAHIAHSFHTTIATFPGDVISRLVDLEPFSILRRRRFEPRLKKITECRPWFEAGRLLALKMGIRNLTKHETGLFCIDSVYRDLDQKVANNLRHYSAFGATAVYAYEDGARNSFQAAKRLGLQCYYDLPIGYWRAGHRILEIEKERWPSWAATLTGLHNSDDKLNRKDEELWLADRVYVASEFTARTLRSCPVNLPPVEVIPYGFPPVAEERKYRLCGENESLKLLFVGGLTQRKGIANLFAAIKPLKRYVKLTVVGKRTSNSCPALDAELVNHRWIPGLAHADILKMMQQHDVLVFPSLFEGFGLVITEAMSQGTPVITTDHTAGPDLIDHKKNGWIIKAGSTEALRSVIEDLLHQRKMIPEFGRAAMATARRRPWNVYGYALAHSVAKQKQEVYPVRG